MDYAVYYSGDKCYVEVLADGSAYDANSLNIAYHKVKPDLVTTGTVALGMEAIERRLGGLGVVPDLICARAIPTIPPWPRSWRGKPLVSMACSRPRR